MRRMFALLPLFAGAVLAAPPETRPWTIAGAQVEATYQGLVDSQVTLKSADGKESKVAFDTLSTNDQKYVLDQENGTEPRFPPPWIPGYKVRFPVRILDEVITSNQTVIVRIPTGGWLKPDASDLAVLVRSGRRIPAVVLSHDPLGDTLCQFRRNGLERWYWIYIANPSAPDRDKDLEARIKQAKQVSEQAVLAKMAAMKRSADRAGELRDVAALVDKERATIQQATTELDQWNKMLPERETAARQTAEKVPPLKAEAEKAAAAAAPFEKDANEKTATARTLEREAAELRAKANQLTTDHDATAKLLAASQETLKQTEAAFAAAQKAADLARQNADAAKREADQARAQADATKVQAAAAQQDAAKTPQADATYARKIKAVEKLQQDAVTTEQQAEAARQKLEQNAQASTAAAQALDQAKAQRDAVAKTAADQGTALERLKKEKAAADGAATAREKASTEAGEKAQAARLAAAPTATAKANADAAFAQANAAAVAADQALAAAKNRIAELTKLKGEANGRLAALMPKYEPLKKAAEDAAREADQAATAAVALEKSYFDVAFEADPRLFKEGLTVEFREWAGDKLSSWPAVVEGLQKSENVIGASVVGEILQNANPFRRYDPRNFAASYRGYLKVDQPGIYSFFVNGDDAGFFFINGYLVYSRTGSNPPIRGKVPTYSVGADIQLEAGVHPFEVHHIVGNTPDATGLATLMWLTPGQKQWQFVPRAAYAQALSGAPAGIESFDGKPVAVFDAGVSDSLTADGITLYLCRFEAQSSTAGFRGGRWDFGDGATGTGASLYHVFFDAKTYEVKLASHASLPPFRRRCQVWVPPTVTCPAALDLAVRSFDATDVARLDAVRLNDLFHFLLICQQSSRWPAMERVCRQLLKNPKLDLKYRACIYGSLMQALAEQGKAKESLALLDPALKEVGNFRTLQILLNLDAANLNRDYLRDYQSADALYATILENNLRLRHPLVRETAVAWGDMALDAGDLAKAATAYRASMSLGGVGVTGETQGDAVERGALLRMAEQQLRTGNVRQTRRLLERIETEFPEQKLEGLYRFLRGEAERTAGRYEQAIRNYEILLQLPQWAGYHAYARYGIADSHYRMGELAKASEWLADLAAREPAAYQEKGLELNGRLKARQAALQALASNKASTVAFRVFENGFDPGPLQPDPSLAYARVQPSLGFHGPNSAWLDTRPGTRFFTVPLGTISNLPPQGSLWVEVWYRDILSIPGGDNARHVRADITTDANEGVGAVSCILERTFGQWHKAAMLAALPRTLNGKASVAIYDTGGFLQVGAVSIRHISDAQMEGLTRFLEGETPQ